MKPFLSNKGGLNETDNMLIKNDEIFTDNFTLTKIFNDHYIDIVEKSSRKNQLV